MKFRIKKIIFLFLLAVLFATVAFLAFVFFDKNGSQTSSGDQERKIALEKQDGRVLGESGTDSQAEPLTKFNSQNYHVPQIIVGSEGGIFYPGADEQKEISAGDIKSEIFTDKNKKNKKILLTWSTNKPVKSSIEYEKSGTGNGVKYDESGYNAEHAVLLEPLESLTTYNYTIAMKDRGGTIFTTEKFAIYTGSPQLSFLDLLAGAFKGVFGWAMK